MTMQSLITGLLVATAVALLARRVVGALRELRSATRGTPACGDGCGCAPAATSTTVHQADEWDAVAPAVTRDRVTR
ncbi:MAG: hypothetical protein MUE41_03955 [Gemmatimonadaceae bacterium]|jgi:hypothetical protein|nr:hypothetical protein [Gemmatimonadaceae bacterium]